MSTLHPFDVPLPIDPTLLSTEVIEAELVASVTAQSASTHQQLHLLMVYDQRGAWVTSGYTSCASWWAATADIEVSTAQDQMRVARAIDRLPSLDLALSTQRLSYAKIRYLSRHVEPTNVDELIRRAQDIPAGRLGYMLAAYNSERLGADEMNAKQHASRSVSWRTDADGMYVFTARLLPIDGAALATNIDAAMMRDNTAAGGDLVGHQRCDAFLRILEADEGPTSSSASGDVVVYVTRNKYGKLVHTLEDGTPLPDAQASELMCGATLRALVHDSNGNPIDVSPAAPGPSKRQYRLIKARDKHCQYKRCRATAFLHAHHIQFRENDGPTAIANLTLLCSKHHRHIHANEPRWKPAWKRGLD